MLQLRNENEILIYMFFYRPDEKSRTHFHGCALAAGAGAQVYLSLPVQRADLYRVVKEIRLSIGRVCFLQYIE